jgi:probable rRNA maturation factor
VKNLQKKILNALVSEINSDKFDSVSLYFTNDKEIKTINKNFRKKDKATDVLSFASLDSSSIPSWDKSLGELIISTDTLKVQAKKYGVSNDQELLRLLVHGTLHLLGYDHENVSKAKASAMMRKQRILIANLFKDIAFRSRNYFVI